jgi:lactoylglutathione lyase
MKTRFVYTGIRVKDMTESVEFYTNLLGMKLLRRHKIDKTKGEIAVLTSENQDFYLELNWYEKDSPYYVDYTVGEALDHLAFQVKDLGLALKEASEKGYQTVAEVKTSDNRWVYIRDPNGIWIELYE